jgi:hypothetical protein
LVNDGYERIHLRIWDMLPWIVNGTASESVRREVQAHLRVCARCCEELAHQRHVHTAMNAGSEPDLAVERGLARLMRQVEAQEQQAARDAGAGGGRIHRRWSWIAWGLAAVVLVEAGGLVALSTSGRNASPSYHSAPSSSAASPQASIRLVVDATMTAGKLQSLLLPLELQIVGGPNEDGVYLLHGVGGGRDVESAVTALRAAPGVRFVEPVGTARGGR